MTRIHLVVLAALASASSAHAAPQLWGIVDGTSGTELMHDVVADGAGGAFLTAATSGPMAGANQGSWDIYVARYSALGDLLWEQQIGTGQGEFGTAIVPDGTGGCFVASLLWGNGPIVKSDAVLLRLDASGQVLWSRQFGTPDNELGMRVAQDGAGGVYFACDTLGALGGPSSGAEDIWLARLDGAGNTLWTTQFGTPQIERLGDLVEDGAGGVYLCGQTTGDLVAPNAGGADGWIARIDAGGATQWIVQEGTAEDEDYERLVLDAPDRLYLVGTSRGALGAQGAGEEDVLVARYDDTGARAWVRQFGGELREVAYGVGRDGLGGVIAVGLTHGDLFGPSQGGVDCWMAQVRADGTLAWANQFGSAAYDEVRGVCESSPGRFILGGDTHGALYGQQNKGGFGDLFVAMYEGCAFAEPDTYCPAVANSTGAPAALTHEGSTSIALNDLAFVVEDAPPGNLGIVMQATQQAQQPFGDGTLCVGGSVQRILPPVFLSPQGSGALSIDFGDPTQPPSQIAPGQTWYFQFWYRDADSTAAGFNLSNGLAATFCP